MRAAQKSNINAGNAHTGTRTAAVSAHRNTNLSAFPSLIAIATTSERPGFTVGFDCCVQKGSKRCPSQIKVDLLKQQQQQTNTQIGKKMGIKIM